MKRLSTVLFVAFGLLVVSGVATRGPAQAGTVFGGGAALNRADVVPFFDVGYTPTVGERLVARELPGATYHAPADDQHPEAAAWKPDPALEIVEERGRYSKTYRDPDDELSRYSVIGTGPLHYRNEAGEWADIDTTIKKGASGELVVLRNHFETRLAPQVRDGYLAEVKKAGHFVRLAEDVQLMLQRGDGSTEVINERAQGMPAEVEGNTARYPAAVGGDLILRVTQSVVSEVLMLPSVPTGLDGDPDASLVMRETVRLSEGLVPYLDGEPVTDAPQQGRRLYVADPEGEVLFTFGEVVAFEAREDGTRAGWDSRLDGRYRVARDGQTLTVEKIIPGAWFAAPDRRYPVAVDPDVEVTVRPGTGESQTAWVWYCGGCYGEDYHYLTSTSHFVVSRSSSTQIEKAAMKFDVSSLPRYITTVNWARLEIYVNAFSAWNGAGNMRFGDVNVDICDHDTVATASGLYGAIDGGANWCTSTMGNRHAPHWHQIRIDSGGPKLDSNRNSNVGYWNVGVESDNDGMNMDVAAHGSSTYPKVIVNYTVQCTSAGNCNDNISCTDDICNSGRCENPISSGQCRISGACYNDGYVNPSNQCQRCWAANDNDAWSNDNALTCTDSNNCTHTDHCSSGSCVGSPYTCNDGHDCTTDTCDGDGTCTFTVNDSRCLINGICYNRGDDNPSEPCQECRDDWGGSFKVAWGWNNANTCNDGDACTYNDHCSSGTCVATSFSCEDNKTCTQDICNGDNTCTHNILPNTCYIDQTCYANDQTSPFNDCQVCDPSANTVWTNHDSGTLCGDDGYACTADTCDGSGTCLHSISDGTCLIGSICYGDGDDHPTDLCHECNSTLSKTSWSNVPNDTVNRACYAPPCVGGAHGIGICHNGIQWCVDGAWNNCAGMQCPEADICDSLDNDCDGNTDEGYPAKGNPCDGSDYDECVTGTLTCTIDGADLECVNDGAFAFYSFAEGSGATTSSISGPVGDGMISGATWTTAGKWGTPALVFNGVDNYVDVPHHPVMDVTNALSMEAWIYPTSASGTWQVIGGLYNGAPGGYYMAVNFSQGPGLSANMSEACGWVYGNSVPPLDTWTHVAMTYDGAAVKLYMDGTLVVAEVCDGNGGALTPSTSPLHIGGLGAYNPTQAPFAGAVDDFGIYGSVLTADEIKSRALEGDHCDGQDNDCDGITDEATYEITYQSGHTPTHGHKGDSCDGADSDWCEHGTLTCESAGLMVECANENPVDIPEQCDGLDNDCNTELPLDEHDDDNDGFMICEGDCDDNSVYFHPDMDEICDGFDNNCDNTTLVGERDLDNDLHRACVPGEVSDPSHPDYDPNPLHWDDCDDNNNRIHKDFPEVCDGLDNDCDGLTDDADDNLLVPVVDSHSPIGVAAGATGLDITFYGKNFVGDAGIGLYVTTIDFGYGVTINSVDVLSSTQMIANIDVATANGDEEQLYSARDIVITIGDCGVVIKDGFDVVDPALVPTLTQWGVTILSALLLAFGLGALRRRRLGHIAV